MNEREGSCTAAHAQGYTKTPARLLLLFTKRHLGLHDTLAKQELVYAQVYKKRFVHVHKPSEFFIADSPKFDSFANFFFVFRATVPVVC